MKSNFNRESAPASPEAVKRAFLARIGAMALAATLFAAPTATAKNRPAKNPTLVAGEAAAFSETESASNPEEPIEEVSFTAGEATTWSDSTSSPNEEEASLPTAGAETFFNSPKEENISSGKDEEAEEKFTWDGPVLNAEMGLNHGPTGEETFYNLPMDEIVARMHRRGVEGDYWEREDGVKMLGDYVMVAADLKLHPRGSIVETSLGTGMVCDTGGFIKEHPERLDIATNWEDPRKNKVVE